MESIANNLSRVEGEVGKFFLDNVEKVLNKNSGFDTLYKIADVLSRSKFSLNEEERKTGDICCFKYLPLSSVDVERSFSMFKITSY